jgi:septal ring factor EnvC (AmiA/AmiB activator)
MDVHCTRLPSRIGRYIYSVKERALADEPESHTLILLREIGGEMKERFDRLDANLDRVTDDMRDIKARMTNAEEARAGVNRRRDRLDSCLERVEKRLDLVQV